VGGDVTLASDGEAQIMLGAEPGCLSLGYKEVHEGGERAALAHPSEPQGRGRLHAVGICRGGSMREKDAGPVDHAWGGAHGLHDLEEEGPADGVKGLCCVQKESHGGRRCRALIGHGGRMQRRREERVEEDIVTYEAAR
jgi:hypothetical protein